MKMIICKACGENKEHVAKGLCSKCYDKEYRLNHPEVRQSARKKYNESPKGKKVKKEYRKNYYQINKISEKLASRNYGLIHKDELKQYQKFRYDHPSGIPHIKNTGKKLYWIYPYGKYVHTYIAEQILKRPFEKGDGVHHFDGNGLNNDLTNLIIYFSIKDHHALEKAKRRLESLNLKEKTC